MSRTTFAFCSAIAFLSTLTLAQDLSGSSCATELGGAASCATRGNSLLQKKVQPGERAILLDDGEEPFQRSINELKSQLSSAHGDQKRALVGPLDTLYGRIESELEHTAARITLLQGKISAAGTEDEKSKHSKQLEELGFSFHALWSSLPSKEDEMSLLEQEVDADNVEEDDDQDIEGSHRKRDLSTEAEMLQLKIQSATNAESRAIVEAARGTFFAKVENKLEEISVKVGTLQNKLAKETAEDIRGRIKRVIDKLEARSTNLAKLLPEDDGVAAVTAANE